MDSANITVNIDMTANVIRPGDRVLLVTKSEGMTRDQLQPVMKSLHREFPGVHFAIVHGVDAYVQQDLYAHNKAAIMREFDTPLFEMETER